jgi:hypothetical protein
MEFFSSETDQELVIECPFLSHRTILHGSNNLQFHCQILLSNLICVRPQWEPVLDQVLSLDLLRCSCRHRAFEEWPLLPGFQSTTDDHTTQTEEIHCEGSAHHD